MDWDGSSFSSTGAGNVTLGEDGSAFGFKFAAVNSSLTGATVTGPTGAPASVGVDFGATLPNPGESLSFDMTLPDGTTTTVSLKATTATPAGEGEFTIGNDAASTTANFPVGTGWRVENRSADNAARGFIRAGGE